MEISDEMSDPSQHELIDLVSDMLNSWTSYSSKREDLDIVNRRNMFICHLNKLYTCSGVSPSCIVVALEYLERFLKRHSSIHLTYKTFHRLVLVAVMTAAKYLEDHTIVNRDW